MRRAKRKMRAAEYSPVLFAMLYSLVAFLLMSFPGSSTLRIPFQLTEEGRGKDGRAHKLWHEFRQPERDMISHYFATRASPFVFTMIGLRFASSWLSYTYSTVLCFVMNGKGISNLLLLGAFAMMV